MSKSILQMVKDAIKLTIEHRDLGGKPGAVGPLRDKDRKDKQDKKE